MARDTAKHSLHPKSARDGAADRWAAIIARDKSRDGAFVYSVATTGVYCRPSCPSRQAKRENVCFHDTPSDAERAGFRACKRCRPDGPAPETEQARRVAAACRLIEEAEEMPLLASLARAAGLSPYHFHRQFKAATGVTPRAYAAAERNRRLRTNLPDANTVTEAIFGSGYQSTSRFYATASKVLGMTPSAYRAGGNNEVIRFAVGQCSLGAILVAASAKGIVAILLGDDPESLLRDLQDRFPMAGIEGGDAGFEKLVARVIAYVEYPSEPCDLPLDVRGTAFQTRVWQALRDIPFGATASYSEIADRIGKPDAVRAVASACGANPVAILIPCHRVVRNDGALSGYRWGIERKRTLLEREAARAKRQPKPAK